MCYWKIPPPPQSPLALVDSLLQMSDHIKNSMVEVLESGELTAFYDFIKYTTLTDDNSDQEDRLGQRICRWSLGNKSCPVTSQIILDIELLQRQWLTVSWYYLH